MGQTDLMWEPTLLTALRVKGETRVLPVGEDEAGGPGPDCDPERYNVDGPAERLLKKGVSRIIMVDWTVGGPRFSKSFDVIEMTKRAVASRTWE